MSLGQDLLDLLRNQPGITGSWNAADGSAHPFRGVASLVAYQIALRSVTYVNAFRRPIGSFADGLYS